MESSGAGEAGDAAASVDAIHAVDAMDAAQRHTRNAAAMWSALVPRLPPGDGVLRVPLPGHVRLLVTRPVGPDELGRRIAWENRDRPLVVEDAFGDAAPATTRPLRPVTMPIMLRAAAEPGPPSPSPWITVRAVRGSDGLAAAEQVIVDGFPVAGLQPYVRGQALPERTLDLPGWTTWLATWDGMPAGTAYTYDDGETVGLYWLATLPAFRSRGVGRAVLTTALNAAPARVFSLVATVAGRPLYEALGFVAAAGTTWYLDADPPQRSDVTGGQA